jgi:ankyrin repeat protein
MLFELSAQANVVDAGGNTPIQTAIIAGQETMVEVFLEMPGVNLDTRNNDGRCRPPAPCSLVRQLAIFTKSCCQLATLLSRAFSLLSLLSCAISLPPLLSRAVSSAAI